MRYIIGILCLLLSHDAMAVRHCKPTPSWWKQGWGTTFFIGPWTAQTSSKISKNAGFGHAGIVGIAASKELVSLLNKRLDFELEAQLVQHFGDEHQVEGNPVVLIARWRSFPWNKTLPTTFAIGDGISISSSKLEKEAREKSAKTLNYVMAEATFSAPSLPQWAFILRYHHRSGMFGTFWGVHDASTAFVAGVKYWFKN